MKHLPRVFLYEHRLNTSSSIDKAFYRVLDLVPWSDQCLLRPEGKSLREKDLALDVLAYGLIIWARKIREWHFSCSPVQLPRAKAKGREPISP